MQSVSAKPRRFAYFPGSRIAAASAMLALVAVATTGCATTSQAGRNDEPSAAPRERNPDPFEPMNRGIWEFNQVLDRYALRPIAKTYDEYTPHLVRVGIGNFFENLSYPTTILHQFLQGKPKQGSQDIGRFVLNTTLGWGGLIDVASGGTNLPKHQEDSGQTLGRWGVPPGPFLMLPFLGPATVRDTPARIADDFSQPFRWYDSGAERWVSLGLSLIDTRARLLPLDKVLDQTYDPYAFVRNAYLQRRQYAVFDGNPPADAAALEDEASWAEEALKDDAADAEDEVAPTELPPSQQ